MTARRLAIAIATRLAPLLVGPSPAAASRFAGHTHYARLRLKGRRVPIDSPRCKPADPNCCPSLGSRTESATWDGRRCVKRVVAVRRP